MFIQGYKLVDIYVLELKSVFIQAYILIDVNQIVKKSIANSFFNKGERLGEPLVIPGKNFVKF